MINVVYHANCYDGFGSMWSAKRALDYMQRDVTYSARAHGEDEEQVKNKIIVFVDFCPKRPVLNLLGKDNLVLVLDHHISAQEDVLGIRKDGSKIEGVEPLPKMDRDFTDYLEDFESGLRGVYCTFDMNKSGAGITYRYFHKTDRLNQMIKFIEDRDIWKFEFGEATKAFHAYLLSQPFDYDVWTQLAEESEDHDKLEEIINSGKGILKYCDQLVKNIVEPAKYYEVNGKKYAIFNTTSHWAEVGEEVYNNSDVDYSIALTIDYSKNQIRGSVRSRPDVDCLPIAKHFGGGGHSQACGFQLPLTTSPAEIIEKIDELLRSL